MRILSFLVFFFVMIAFIEAGVIVWLWNKDCPSYTVQEVRGTDTIYLPEPIIVESVKYVTDTVEKPFTRRVWDKVTGKREGWHKVRGGQNLYRIALKYNLSVQQLKDINGLTSDDIQKGQWLKVIPDHQDYDSLYTYRQHYEDSIADIWVLTKAYGPMYSQSAEWTIKPYATQSATRGLYLGASGTSDAGLGVMAAYQNKNNGVFFAGRDFMNRTWQVGYMHRVNLKK